MVTLHSSEVASQEPSLQAGGRFDRARLIAAVPGRALLRVHRPAYLILCYHLVADGDVDHVQHVFDYKSPAQFRADLEYLAEHHGRADAGPFAWFPVPRPTRRGEALLTFDDGHRECATVVQPLLKALSFSAIFFVTTNAINNRCLLPQHLVSVAIARLLRAPTEEQTDLFRVAQRVFGIGLVSTRSCVEYLGALMRRDETERLRELLAAWGNLEDEYLARVQPYLSESEVRTMAEDGFVIGAHGVDHMRLHHVPADKVERQIVESCARIKSITHQDVVPFAFPYSMRVNLRLLGDIARRHPFVGAFFGAGGVWQMPDGFYNRIVADWRWRAESGLTNLPILINHAYLMAAEGGVRGIGRRLRKALGLNVDIRESH